MNSDKNSILKSFLEKLKELELFNTNISGEYYSDPFDHIRIFNVFSDEVYQQMCLNIEKFCSYIQSDDYSSGGESKKYAKIFGMLPCHSKNDGYSFFSSNLFLDFISKIFEIELTKFFAASCHLHEGTSSAPSTLGWPHLDLNVCQFNKNADQEFYLNDIQYADDLYANTSMNYDPNKVDCAIRSSATLFYLNNKENLKDEDGGGTFIYDDPTGKNPIKLIKPYNNSLFAFKIGNNSYHGVQPAKFHRYAHVSWTHSNPSEFVKKNFESFVPKIEQGLPLFEDWNVNSRWNIEKCSRYKDFFKNPLKFIIKKY